MCRIHLSQREYRQPKPEEMHYFKKDVVKKPTFAVSRTGNPQATIVLSREGKSNMAPFIEGLREHLNAEVIFRQDFESPAAVAEYIEQSSPPLTIFFARFRWLKASTDMHYRSNKVRVIFDLDAGQNYAAISTSSLQGVWSKYLPKFEADLIVSTDKVTTERLNEEGIPTYWLPKASGFSPERLISPPKREHNIGSYGSVYGARAHALAMMKKNKVAVHHFSASYETLRDTIASHRAILICNSASEYLFPRAKGLQKNFPLLFIKPKPSIMVMAKNYEVCAAGSLMLADDIAELHDLGFESGKNCLLYSSPAEMVEMGRWIEAHPIAADEIALRGQELVNDRHTTAHRIDQILPVLKGLIENRLGFRPT